MPVCGGLSRPFFTLVLSHANCGWPVPVSLPRTCGFLSRALHRVMLWSLALLELSWNLVFFCVLRALSTGMWSHIDGVKSHVPLFSLGHSSLWKPWNSAALELPTAIFLYWIKRTGALERRTDRDVLSSWAGWNVPSVRFQMAALAGTSQMYQRHARSASSLT